MSCENNSNILLWLDELRFCTENYESFTRPLSGGSDLTLLLSKNSDHIRKSVPLQLEKNTQQEEDGMGLYEKLWDFQSDNSKNASERSNEGNLVDVKHADVCRVSVVFQDCEDVQEEQGDIHEPVTVENIELFLSKDVLEWITDLWYSSEEEDVEEFEEFEKYQQSRVEDTPTSPPKFPVQPQEPVQLRKSNSLKPNRISSRSNTIHVVQAQISANQLTEQDIQISAPLKLTWRGGRTEAIDRGAVVYKNGLLQIQNDSNKSKREMRMNSTLKTNKICEFSSGEQLLKVSVEKEHQITMGSPRQRRKSVEEDSPKNINKQNILMKLLRRRSDKHLLEKKGIFKNEDIFGNELKVLYENSNSKVPEFVKRAVELIETDKNIKSEHIYRLSGNMATIQKIRLKIDGKNYKVLDEYRNDVDVLTGCLKLFYRELVEPLIPYKTFEELNKLTTKPPSVERDKSVKTAVKRMDTPNKENLLFLIQHLLTVESYKQHNKMTIQSLSIVWGPSMLWYPGGEKCIPYTPYEFSMLVNAVLELVLTTYQTDPETVQQIQNKYDNTSESLADNSLRDFDTVPDEYYKKSPSASSSSSKWLFGLRKAESKDKLTGSNWNLAESSKKGEPASVRIHCEFFEINREIILEKVTGDYFGKSLESLPKSENYINIPRIIVQMVDVIERQPQIKGLYCKPASRDPLGKFKKKMQKSKVDLSKLDPLDVAVALLRFLQELERPLLHRAIYEDFKDNFDKVDDIQKVELVKEDIANLPEEHQDTIEFVVNHLLNIFEQQDKDGKENVYNAWLPIFSNSTEINSYNLEFMETVLDIYQTKRNLPTSVLPLKKDFRYQTRQFSRNSTDENYVSDTDKMGLYNRNDSIKSLEELLDNVVESIEVLDDGSKNNRRSSDKTNPWEKIRYNLGRNQQAADGDSKFRLRSRKGSASPARFVNQNAARSLEIGNPQLQTTTNDDINRNTLRIGDVTNSARLPRLFTKEDRIPSSPGARRKFIGSSEFEYTNIDNQLSPKPTRKIDQDDVNKMLSVGSPKNIRKDIQKDNHQIGAKISPTNVRKLVENAESNKAVVTSPIPSRKLVNVQNVPSEDFDRSKPNMFAKNLPQANENKRIEFSKVHVNALNKIIGAQSLEHMKARTEMAYKKT